MLSGGLHIYLFSDILKIRKGVTVTNTKVVSVLEDVSIGVGLAVSIETIQSILGIVILCFQVGLIIFKFGKKIYNKIKEKRYNEIGKDISEAKEQIETVVANHNANKKQIEESSKRNE